MTDRSTELIDFDADGEPTLPYLVALKSPAGEGFTTQQVGSLLDVQRATQEHHPREVRAYQRDPLTGKWRMFAACGGPYAPRRAS